MTWLLVTTSPSGEMTMPVPAPRPPESTVLMSTTADATPLAAVPLAVPPFGVDGATVRDVVDAVLPVDPNSAPPISKPMSAHNAHKTSARGIERRLRRGGSGGSGGGAP